MPLTQHEIAASYLPLFSGYLELRGVADQYEVIAKTLTEASTLRYEARRKHSWEHLHTIQFMSGKPLSPSVRDQFSRLIAHEIDALVEMQPSSA